MKITKNLFFSCLFVCVTHAGLNNPIMVNIIPVNGIPQVNKGPMPGKVTEYDTTSMANTLIGIGLSIIGAGVSWMCIKTRTDHELLLADKEKTLVGIEISREQKKEIIAERFKELEVLYMQCKFRQLRGSLIYGENCDDLAHKFLAAGGAQAYEIIKRNEAQSL